MCYKWPGARCYSHGKEDYAKKEKAFVDATILAVKTGDPEHMESVEAAKREMVKAEMDMYATKEGLGVYKEKLDQQFDNKEINGKQRDDQYHNARDVYTTRMNAYDRKNKTVDGRKPSKEWRPEAQREIVAKINQNSLLLAEYQKDRNKADKIKPLQNKQRLLQNRLDHARMTRNHITEKGYLTATDVDAAHTTKDAKPAARSRTASKPAATRKNSANKVAPFHPEPADVDENGGWVGAKYDRSRTNQQIASATRADLKKAVETGTLPSDYTYKVKNKGNRIEVDVIGNHESHVDKYPAAHGGLISRVTNEGINFRAKVQQFPNQYAYNKSQAQFDNFNQSHHIFVNFIDGETGNNVRH